jgi:hypothetical protein
MELFRTILSRCVGFFRGNRLDQDLDEELNSHIDLAIEEKLSRGVPVDEARTAALREFGGVTQTKEDFRNQRGLPFLEILLQDTRYVLRQLRKSPGFTLTVVITLALGIGANTAIFTLVQGILLRSLPVNDPSRLYRIGDKDDCCYYDSFQNDNGDFDLFSDDLYRHFKQSTPEFEQLAAVEAGGSGYSMRYGSLPAKSLRTEYVSGNYFSTLGVGVYAGRPLIENDDTPGAAPTLVLNYQTWQADFAGDPHIVGATVYLNTHPFTVAGIAPPGFFGDRVAVRPPEVWLPLASETVLDGANASVKQPDTHWLYALGRLRPDVNRDILQTKLSVALRQWLVTRAKDTEHGGSPHTVLLSYSTWQRRFNGSPNVIGRAITLSDTSYTIIGVLPSEFQFAPRGASEFWTALNDPSSCELRRACHSLFGLARLKDGVSLQSALAEMKTIELQLAKQYPDANRGFSADVVKLTEVVAGDIRPILLMLLGGACLLLLIACVNVSSLLVVRSESRKREIAVRGALGASPTRLVRQFVTEGVVLVLAGSLLGLVSAYFAVHLLIRLIPAGMVEAMPYLAGLGLNLRVMAFAGLISLLAAILFSIVPALRLSREDLRGCLAEGGRGSAGMLWRRLGSKLVVLELATAMVLLVGAGLLGKSLYRLLHVDIGFDPDHIATLLITMPSSYQENIQVMRLERQLVSRIGSLPGVKSVGISTSLPSSSWGMATNILVSGRPSNGEHNTVPERDVSSNYLKTLGAKLLRGRYFTEAEDDPSKAHVAVINQTFAKQYFPGEDPIGKRLLYEGSQEPIEIVGLVEDIKNLSVNRDNLSPTDHGTGE